MTKENWDRSVTEIHEAALIWYGRTDMDSCCLAENRLARGEKPHQKEEKVND